MAAAGLTHVVHLLTGFAPGQPLRRRTHADIAQACASASVPCPLTPPELDRLWLHMPPQWHRLIQAASRAKLPHHDLGGLLLAMPTVPRAWYAYGDLAGRPYGPDTVSLTHHVSPIGVLTPSRTPLMAPLSRCTQIHVWRGQP